VQTNCHPFTFGRHVFCHNGVLGSFHLFKAKLLASLPIRYQVAILGTTDSEHMAALYFYHLFGADGDWHSLRPEADMVDAMRKTLALLAQMKDEAEKALGDGKTEHSALNLLVNSGSSLVALRYASTSTEAPSLYYSTEAGADLNRKFKGHPDEGKPGAVITEGEQDKGEHGKHVIVASEPSTFKAEDWHLIEPGEMVVVHEDMTLEKQML
jgi:glutamine amidotransferase